MHKYSQQHMTQIKKLMFTEWKIDELGNSNQVGI